MDVKLTDTERSHGSVLGVDLVDVGHALGEHIWGDLVSKLVPKLGCLPLCPAHGRSSIGHKSCHHTTNLGRQRVNVSDRRCVQEFILQAMASISAGDRTHKRR